MLLISLFQPGKSGLNIGLKEAETSDKAIDVNFGTSVLFEITLKKSTILKLLLIINLVNCINQQKLSASLLWENRLNPIQVRKENQLCIPIAICIWQVPNGCKTRVECTTRVVSKERKNVCRLDLKRKTAKMVKMCSRVRFDQEKVFMYSNSSTVTI